MFNRFQICILSLFTILGCTKDEIKPELKTNHCIFDAVITDIDGNNYNTIIIGTQCWMAENLRTTRYNNGQVINECNDDSIWSRTNQPSYCSFNSDSKSTSGYIYNGYTIDKNGVCPHGWHVPEEREWLQLFETVGGIEIAGRMLKESGTSHWAPPNTNSTNEFCFNALPASDRANTGQFYNSTTFACWWTSTLQSDYYCLYRIFNNNPGVIKITNQSKNYGYPIRCVKDTAVRVNF